MRLPPKRPVGPGIDGRLDCPTGFLGHRAEVVTQTLRVEQSQRWIRRTLALTRQRMPETPVRIRTFRIYEKRIHVSLRIDRDSSGLRETRRWGLSGTIGIFGQIRSSLRMGSKNISRSRVLNG